MDWIVAVKSSGYRFTDFRRPRSWQWKEILATTRGRSSLCVCQHAQIKHTVLRSLMGKKKSGSNKASVKEAKKAKAAAKVERKEAKAQKQSKGRDAEDDEDDDLEGILERVRSNSKD